MKFLLLLFVCACFVFTSVRPASVNVDDLDEYIKKIESAQRADGRTWKGKTHIKAAVKEILASATSDSLDSILEVLNAIKSTVSKLDTNIEDQLLNTNVVAALNEVTTQIKAVLNKIPKDPTSGIATYVSEIKTKLNELVGKMINCKGKDCALDVIKNALITIRDNERMKLPSDFNSSIRIIREAVKSINITLSKSDPSALKKFIEFLNAIKDRDSYYYLNQDYYYNKTLFDVLDSVFGYRNVSHKAGFTRGHTVGWFWDGITNILTSIIKPFVDAFQKMIREVFDLLLPVFNENFKALITLFSTLTEHIIDCAIVVVQSLEPLMEKLVLLLSKLLRVLGNLLFKLFIVLEKEFYITEAILVFAVINIFLINNNIVAIIVTILITFIFGMKRQFDSVFLDLMSVPQEERAIVGA